LTSGVRVFEVAGADGILEFGAETLADGFERAVTEVLHDIFGDGQALFVIVLGRGLRKSKRVDRENGEHKQKEISQRAHRDLPICGRDQAQGQLHVRADSTTETGAVAQLIILNNSLHVVIRVTAIAGRNNLS
jgi:hypothetical protein